MNWKRIVLALLLGATLAAPAAAGAFIEPAPLRWSHNPPPLGRKQGWLVISNRDWTDYSLAIDYDKEKMYLYRQGMGYGTVQIPSGTSITIAMPKDNYDLYGETDDKLEIRVREGRTTSLSLEPFGNAGNTGLNAVVNDGSRTRSEVLFFDRPPVIVQPSPPIVVRPVPPPVIVMPPRPPPVVVRPPPHRPPPHRPPPHRPFPPHSPRPRHDKNKGWGFSLFFD